MIAVDRKARTRADFAIPSLNPHVARRTASCRRRNAAGVLGFRDRPVGREIISEAELQCATAPLLVSWTVAEHGHAASSRCPRRRRGPLRDRAQSVGPGGLMRGRSGMGGPLTFSTTCRATAGTAPTARTSRPSGVPRARLLLLSWAPRRVSLRLDEDHRDAGGGHRR